MDGQQQYADAMRAFDAYYGTRRSVLGIDWPKRKYAEHRSWKVFMKIAAACEKAGRDVERYVTVVLEHMTKNSDQIVPNIMLTKTAEDLWTQFNNRKKADAAGKWAYYSRLIIQIQGATGQSDEAILMSALNSQFPAWFRVLYPETIQQNITQSWGEEAIDELRDDRDLVRFLRAAMPVKMEEFEKKMGVINGL